MENLGSVLRSRALIQTTNTLVLMPPFPTISTPPATAHLLHPLLRSLDLATSLRSTPLATRVHSRAVPLGLHHHPLLSAKLITAYSLLNLPSLSLLVFSALPYPTLPLFNSLLASYSRCSLFRPALSLFNRMRPLHPPDHFTLSILSKASAEIQDPSIGKSIHSLATKLGFASDTVLYNSLMVMYLRCKITDDARRLFDEMTVKSVASWNAMISEYASARDGLSVLKLVRQMQMEGVKPDGYTISTILPLCSVDSGREVHGFVVRQGLGLDSDFHVGSCFISMYSSGGRVDLGRRAFNLIVTKNVFTWTAMITGYVEGGDFVEALMIFRTMQLIDGIKPNKVTLLSILPAVGSLTGLLEGKQIHAYAIRVDLVGEVSVNNALINMYSKCGSLDTARSVFDGESWHKDAISWSSMISGFGIHGRGEEAVGLFGRMCLLGIKLDHITSVSILSACGRAGLVSKGLEIYKTLVEGHGVLPNAEICSCVVDLLGRAGKLNLALDFINSMSFKPGPTVWGALFSASLIHHDQKMQNLAYRYLLQLEPANPSNYISVSNLHASSGRWDSVTEVRTTMNLRGLKKITGYSWICIESEVHSFSVADKSHQSSQIIYALLDHLLWEMKESGHSPQSDNLT